METFYIKQGDLWPPLEANLKQANGEPIPLQETDEVNFIMTFKNKRTSVVIEGEVEVIDYTTAHVKYEWNTGDTDVAGVYQGEFKVMLNGEKLVSIPNNKYFDIIIDNKLGSKEVSV